jgi:hypothetical protein
MHSQPNYQRWYHHQQPGSDVDGLKPPKLGDKRPRGQNYAFSYEPAQKDRAGQR